MKQNQISFHGTYLNLTAYLFLSTYIKVIQCLSKSEILSFMTKLNPINGNETKSDILLWDIFKSDTFFYQKILKYFNDFQNRNSSNLWLKWTQTMEMKENQTFFKGTYSNLALFSLVVKCYNISMTFMIYTFQSHCKSEHNQVKWNKITRDMGKSDRIFFIIFYLQSSTLLNWLSKFISW